MIDEEKIEMLRLRSDRQGAIATGDLREILPVDEMSADELALVVLELEEAGVVIEIDESLMGSSRRRTTTSPQAAVINLPGASGGIGDIAATQVSKTDRSAHAFSPTEPVERATPEHSGAWRLVAGATIVIAIGALVTLLLSR